jgi:hypothetical protein
MKKNENENVPHHVCIIKNKNKNEIYLKMNKIYNAIKNKILSRLFF